MICKNSRISQSGDTAVKKREKMKDIKITSTCYIPHDQIEMYMSYADSTIKTIVRKFRNDSETEKRILDLTARKHTATVILMKSGRILLITTATDTIKKRIDESAAEFYSKMKDIKITSACYIPRDQIEMYMSYADNTTKTMVRKFRNDPEIAKKILDLTARKKTATVIFMKSGRILLITTATDTIKKRIDESEAEFYSTVKGGSSE